MSELASEMYPDYPDPTPEFHFLGGDVGRGLLASALAQPAQTFSGTYLNRTIPDKAAVLLISMIKNHPFVDGNKRIALTTTTVFLSLNGWLFYANRDDAVAECLRVASTAGNVEKGPVASWIRKRSIKWERYLGMSKRERTNWRRIVVPASEQALRFSYLLREMRSLE